MAVIPGKEAITSAVSTWAARCLLSNTSVLTSEPLVARDAVARDAVARDASVSTPGDALWTHAHLVELHKCLSRTSRVRGETFTKKLREQLRPASPNTKRLAAEMVWVMHLFPANIGWSKKVALVQTVWSWSGTTLDTSNPLLSPTVCQGVGRTGQGFVNYRHAEFVFFVEFMQRWKSESAHKQRRLLNDPWEFATFLDKTRRAERRQLRNMLLYLLFPKTFERVASRSDREAIDKYYASKLPAKPPIVDTDSPMARIDRRLELVREMLEEKKARESIDFYDDDIKAEWKHPKSARISASNVSEPRAERAALPRTTVDTGDATPSAASTRARPNLQAIQASFATHLARANVTFGGRHDSLTRAFLASLATKRFVILTGLSGSGKTQLALQFGGWCGAHRALVVPVRPDWTGPEALFGYEDALLPMRNGARAWHVPAPLEFMLRAAADPAHPYVLVLDEMNLAHVERYFSDALSGMESGAACLPNLARHDGLWYPKGDQPYVQFPDNLFVVGTVNVDETTYMFSPKVLDRANTIEFRVHTSELDADAHKPSSCEPGPEDLVRGFLEIARDQEFHRHTPHQAAASFQEALRRMHEMLLETGWEFGHRVYYEAIRFAAMYQASGDPSWEDALDVQILQKILPRLHGSRRKLEPTLVALGRFCVELPVSSDAAHAIGVTGFDPLSVPDTPVRLPRSFDKIRRMTRNLRANQFTGFAE